jgi:hypothetical protein
MRFDAAGSFVGSGVVRAAITSTRPVIIHVNRNNDVLDVNGMLLEAGVLRVSRPAFNRI